MHPSTHENTIPLDFFSFISKHRALNQNRKPRNSKSKSRSNTITSKHIFLLSPKWISQVDIWSYICTQNKEKYFASSVEEEGEIMSRHWHNFPPLPRQRSLRSYDGHTYNHHESNEVPVFYRSNSTHATVSLF